MNCPCTSDGQHVPTFIGTLGSLDHFRCRQCGWDWSEPHEDDDDTDSDEDGRFATDAAADEEAVSGEDWGDQS